MRPKHPVLSTNEPVKNLTSELVKFHYGVGRNCDMAVVVVVVVEPLVYFAFLFFNETVITKTQGLVVAIAKREHINKSK